MALILHSNARDCQAAAQINGMSGARCRMAPSKLVEQFDFYDRDEGN